MNGAANVVIGGGLAGMAAAFALRERGEPVVLLERRPFLGGRAFSFEDPQTGAVIDNGQHVLVGACDRLRAFLDRIGSRNAFRRQRRLRLPILDGRGRRADLAAAPLPAPFHLAVGLLRYRHLDAAARRSVLAAVRELGQEAELDDDRPLGDWLAGRDSPPAAVDRFWEPIVRPALNVRVAEASLPLSAFLVRRALRAGSTAGALWLPTTGLSAAIGSPALARLRAAGVDVRLEARAAALEVAEGRVVGLRLHDGTQVPARRVVCALPPEGADPLLLSAGVAAGFAALGQSAIVNVYLWYDRPVLPVPFAGTFDSPLQWVFDRRKILGEEAGGWCAGISLSAADDLVDQPKEAIAALCDDALGRLFPARGRARLERSAVVKEPRATFRAGPGAATRRPGPVTGIAGLFLAGDWTDTGWPATMEGAVRSGERAAAAVGRSDRSFAGAAAR
ncbi:MAG TPA: hydroxysqualene dehydroxylase HpnE [Gemmatimonadota bacterium]|nr:hydroxysqualene dehydroxylase HpnE [Gemmatimonadota bacterium]